MKKSDRVNLELMEGRRFILGREGHIYIDSPTASKHHAELKIEAGRIYLRDLNSTNGTHLLKNETPVRIDEGYVNPKQTVVIGKHRYVIEDLLAIARDYVIVDDNKTQTDLTGSWKKRLEVNEPSSVAADPE